MSAENSPGGVDRGQVLLIALVVLALIASLIMLFTDSAGALKLALLASLWAAIIGFFLVTQYRRRAERSQEELEHREELHRTELEKLAAERRSEKAGKEIELRDKQLARDTEVLEDIKRELAALRAQLEELNGREFGYEPAALRAEARRIQELEARTSAARSSVTGTSFSDLGGLEDMGDLADLDDESEAPAPGARTSSSTPPRGQVPGAPSPDAIVGRLGQYEPSRPQVNPLSHLISESYQLDRQEEKPAGRKDPRSIFDTGAFQNVPWGQGGAEEAKHQKDSPGETTPGESKPTEPKPASGKKPAEQVKSAEKTSQADQATKADKAEKPEPKQTEKKTKTDKPEKAEKAESKKPEKKPAEPKRGEKADKAAPVKETPEAKKETRTEPEAEPKTETKEGPRPAATVTPGTPGTDATGADDEPRRGRRRRDEHTEGISVAELMANLKKDS